MEFENFILESTLLFNCMYRQCWHIQWKLLGWLLMSFHAACFNSTDIPWILQNLLFLHTSLWQESFLNIYNHWLMKWPMTHLHISLFDLVNPLIFANSCPGWHNYSLWGFLFQFDSQLALKFHVVKTCFFLACIDSVNITNYIEITKSIMPKPVFLLTVQKAYKKYNSLTDQIMGQVWAIRLGWVWRQLAPQHSKLKPVNWLIYLLMWANFAS